VTGIGLKEVKGGMKIWLDAFSRHRHVVGIYLVNLIYTNRLLLLMAPVLDFARIAPLLCRYILRWSSSFRKTGPRN
jgi:hypothetical protein